MDSNKSLENLILSAEHQNELISVGGIVEEKVRAYGESGIEKERREIMREVLGVDSVAPKSITVPVGVVKDEVKKIKELNKPDKIQALLNYAASYGPISASILVKKIGDPWLDDEFHDTLISFHDELVKRNKLKEE